MKRAARALAGFATLLAAVAGCGGGGEGGGEPVSQTSEPVMVCPTATVEGLDVYDGQGTIDWTQVAGSGRAFAFMKATQGDYNTQKTFPANWTGAKAAGVLRSPYHFFDPTIDGVTQANHFLSVLSAQGGLQPGDLAPMLDIECPTASSQSAASPDCEYTGNSGWVDEATMATRIFDWLSTVEKATGRKPFVYSYPSWFADVGFTDAMLAQYPLFIATLASCADVPAPWTTTVFWQYSFTGTVPGITGQVDLDRFNGTMAGLGMLTNPPAADGGADAAPADAAPTDGARPGDASSTDASGSPDTGTTLDSALPDAPIGTSPDAGTASPDAAAPAGSSGGCGCKVTSSSPSPLAPVLALAFAALPFLRRRRTHPLLLGGFAAWRLSSRHGPSGTGSVPPPRT